MIRILWHSGLSKKFYYHKDNIKIINIIQKGSRYQIDTIKEKSRKSDLDLMILRGNYKSSHSYLNSTSLEKSIRKEIDHGWELTLTIKSLQNILKTGVVPLGVTEEFSINERGGHYIKNRVTRDCSFPFPSGLSVNNRVQPESLQARFYGFFLLRILHMISAIWK